MIHLHLPWLELSLVIPLLGAWFAWRVRDPAVARHRALVTCGVTLVCTAGAWLDFDTVHSSDAHDPGDIVEQFLGPDAVVIDSLSAPLLPLAALLYGVIVLATCRTKVRRFDFAGTLMSLSLLLAMLCCRNPWGLIGLQLLQMVPPTVELYARGRSIRIFLLHQGLSVLLLALGWSIWDGGSPDSLASSVAVLLLSVAVLIRSGSVPVHCWMTDLFENATFGTALLFVTPMVGAYVAVRIVLPVAPEWALRAIALVSLITALYSAGMALVQREARRFFCYLFLSHSSLVLVGLEFGTLVGLTGALCVWLSVGVSLAGFGLTLRAVEARCGRLSLAMHHGLYDHMPVLAAFFLLTGLASIGFPGTAGFIGTELLVEGAVEVSPLVGMIVVLTTALNGIAVLQVYFRLFTGVVHTSVVPLTARVPERIAVLVLTVLILGGGFIPQPGVQSRYRAASEIASHQRHGESTEAVARAKQVQIPVKGGQQPGIP